MAQVLASCCSDRKDISFTIQTGPVASLFEKLHVGEIDMAVAEGECPADPELTSVLLDTDNLMLAVCPDHPLAGKEAVSLEELKKEDLILRLPDSGTRNLFQSELESQNMSLSDFHVTLQVDNIATIKELIMQHFGVSILARSVCLKEVQSQSLTLLPIQELRMSREIRLVYRKDFRQVDVISELIRIYDQMLKKKY